MKKASLLGLLLALPVCPPAAAMAAEAPAPLLVRDLDPRPHDPNGAGVLPREFFRAGARTVFVQEDSGSVAPGTLWATDGTPAGTQRLRSFPGYLRLLGSAGEVVFFVTPVVVNDTFREPRRLWRTDGTREGTFPLAAEPGLDRRSEEPAFSAVPFQGALLFSGCTPAWGCELWRSDGTPEGTRRLREIVPGTGGSEPHDLVVFQDRVFFFAEGPAGAGLWRTDGSRPGTQAVINLPPFSSPRGLAVQGDRLYFTAGGAGPSNSLGPQLWTSDGTAAGTRPVPPSRRRATAGAPRSSPSPPGWATARPSSACGGSETSSSGSPIRPRARPTR